MSIHKVDQKSVLYRIIWHSVKIWHDIFYNRKIEIRHLERVPEKGAVIFTPNHQNALMDALTLLFSVNRTIVFLARADIFKKKTIAELLYFFRILPVFRPRDGHGEVKRNQDTFDKTTEVLQKNLGLAIFPEGNHAGRESLRPLKKGFARIAFQTEEGNDYKMNIKIIPVGISYTHYVECQQVVSISFGQPLSISPYFEEYKANPAKAYNSVLEDLSQEMKKNMIHIDDDEYYETIHFLQNTFHGELLGNQAKKFNNRIESSQFAISKIVDFKNNNKEAFEKLHNEVKNFFRKSKTLNERQKASIAKWSWARFLGQSFLIIITSVILIPAYLLIIFPLLLSNFGITFIKDPQFKSTIKFVLTLILFPLFFFVEWILFITFFDSFSPYLFIGIYFMALMIAAKSAHFIRLFLTNFRLFIFKVSHSKSFLQMKLDLQNMKKTIAEM